MYKFIGNLHKILEMKKKIWYTFIENDGAVC